MTLPESVRLAHNPKLPHWDSASGTPLWTEAHEALCECAACEAYFHPIGRDRERALAHNYNTEVLCFVAVIPSGEVVLYDLSRDPIYIGDWAGLAGAYEGRPSPKVRERLAPTVPSALAGITIDI